MTFTEILARTRFYTKVASTTDHTDAEIVVSTNIWQDKVLSWIMQVDKRCEFDDNNQTDEPTKSITLTDSTRTYALTSVTYLKIAKVVILDSSGNYKELDFVTFDSIEAKNLREGNETAGMPTKYSIRGNWISLYPKPSSSNVTLASGLKVFHQRDMVPFTVSSTTAVPGFAKPFHDILPMGNAYDYLKKEGSPRANDLWQMILAMKADLIEFYSTRQKDGNPRMSFRSEDYNENMLGDDSGSSIIVTT